MLQPFPVRRWPVLFAVAFGAACASAPSPAGAPDPASPRASEQPVIVTPPMSIPTTFTYAEGVSTYDLSQVTAVTVGSDGATAEDTLRTTAGLTLLVSGSTGIQAVTVTIDSMVISSLRDTMAPIRQLSGPVIVQLPAISPVADTDSLALLSTCDSMEEAARVLAGDLHIPIPVVVQQRQTWTDSSTSTLCRGGIPLSVTRVSHFEISDVRSSSDSTVMALQRRTTLSLAGSGMQGSRRITVRGTGTSQTLFRYDLRGGRFLGSTGQSELLLGFETIQQTEQVVQRSTTSIQLRSGPGIK